MYQRDHSRCHILTIVALGENRGFKPDDRSGCGKPFGFLLFNVYPAKVFMGRYRISGIGWFCGASALVMQLPLFIPIIGLIYLVEVLSVIIQVTYFKKTGGNVFSKWSDPSSF